MKHRAQTLSGEWVVGSYIVIGSRRSMYHYNGKQSEVVNDR